MVRRDDKDEKHVVYPVMACAIPVVLATDATPNAFTDYRKIVIQSGILRAAQNDSDLAPSSATSSRMSTWATTARSCRMRCSAAPAAR